MNKPETLTLEYLDFFEVRDYLKETKGINLGEKFWDYLCENWGVHNDCYVWTPPCDDDYMDQLDPELVHDFWVLYSEFPNPNGHVFYFCW